VALSTYQSPADSWTAASGESYRVEDVVRLATQRDPRRETEGGPHHLYGIAYALQRHRRNGELLSDAWNVAARYLREYVAIARAFQQSDGAFSGEMFRRSAPPESPRRLVSTTGHMLEWLTVALSPDELREPWVQRAVNRLCETLRSHPLETFSDGGIYHAAHALRRYREAVFAPPG
jgi:hypothetical protein